MCAVEPTDPGRVYEEGERSVFQLAESVDAVESTALSAGGLKFQLQFPIVSDIFARLHV